MEAARKVGRHGHRDATLARIAYRHGLRVSELVALRWDQLDLKAGTLHVNRLKNGRASSHRSGSTDSGGTEAAQSGSGGLSPLNRRPQ
jgi:integrase